VNNEVSGAFWLGETAQRVAVRRCWGCSGGSVAVCVRMRITHLREHEARRRPARMRTEPHEYRTITLLSSALCVALLPLPLPPPPPPPLRQFQFCSGLYRSKSARPGLYRV
jgi:hypothetical protein